MRLTSDVIVDGFQHRYWIEVHASLTLYSQTISYFGCWYGLRLVIGGRNMFLAKLYHDFEAWMLNPIKVPTVPWD